MPLFRLVGTPTDKKFFFLALYFSRLLHKKSPCFINKGISISNEYQLRTAADTTVLHAAGRSVHLCRFNVGCGLCVVCFFG